MTHDEQIQDDLQLRSDHERGLHDPEYGCPSECPYEIARYAEAKALYGHPALAPVHYCAFGCRLDEDNPEHAFGCSDYPYTYPDHMEPD